MALIQISPLTIVNRDAKGVISRTKFQFHFNPNGANAGVYFTNFVNAYQLLTNGSLVSYSGPSSQGPTAVLYGSTTAYQDAADKAVLVYATTQGIVHRFQIPMPVTTLFLPDARTINPANANVVAFNVFMLTVVSTDFQPTDRLGNAFAVFIGGYRRRSKEPRKTNIYLRDANLTPQEPEGP